MGFLQGCHSIHKEPWHTVLFFQPYSLIRNKVATNSALYFVFSDSPQWVKRGKNTTGELKGLNGSCLLRGCHCLTQVGFFFLEMLRQISQGIEEQTKKKGKLSPYYLKLWIWFGLHIPASLVWVWFFFPWYNNLLKVINILQLSESDIYGHVYTGLRVHAEAAESASQTALRKLVSFGACTCPCEVFTAHNTTISYNYKCVSTVSVTQKYNLRSAKYRLNRDFLKNRRLQKEHPASSTELTAKSFSLEGLHNKQINTPLLNEGMQSRYES